MDTCEQCGEPAEYRHENGSLFTYWFVTWRCEKHACEECQYMGGRVT